MDSTHLRITARRPGFRRAGRAWPGQPVTVPAADFTPEQIAALEAEPLLVVEWVAVPSAPVTPDAPAGPARPARKGG